jgi:hypothetical protein
MFVGTDSVVKPESVLPRSQFPVPTKISHIYQYKIRTVITETLIVLTSLKVRVHNTVQTQNKDTE